MRGICVMSSANCVMRNATARATTCANNARKELREDWRDYRRSHRDVYRGGNWRAPFRYNRWEVGSQLRPSYYNSRYYISDPYRYRLSRPGNPNLRWVRHYNDVLLVNVRSGRVMEVHRGFFW